MRAYRRTLVLAALTAAVLPQPAPAENEGTAVCSPSSLNAVDGLSGITSPCSLTPGGFLLEGTYFQNASAVGGTALAGYPLLRLRAGVVKRLEAVVDAPSQIAQSGPQVRSVYPTTPLGYGINYAFLQAGRGAAALDAEVLPPASRYMTVMSQPRYQVSVTGDYRLEPALTLIAFGSGISSRAVGLQRFFPSAALGAAYDAGRQTQLTIDVGGRTVARRAASQSFGDATLNQRLRRNLTADVGVGTTFNPVSNAKAHYLAGGLGYGF